MVQISSGNIKSNEAHILKFIKERTEKGFWCEDVKQYRHYTTLVELEDHMTAKQSTITSRVSSLEDIGVIYPKGTVTKNNGPNGENISYSCFYYEPRPQIQEENSNKRKNKKFRRVVDHLIDNYSDKLDRKTIEGLKKDLSLSYSSQTKLF